MNEANKNKLDKSQDPCKKRIRIKWFQTESRRDKPKSASSTKTAESNYNNNNNNNNVNNNCAGTVNKGGKYVNRECIGERETASSDVAGSLTCSGNESGRVTPANRARDRFATKVNNNYNFKYYGFLDSGDENTNETGPEVDSGAKPRVPPRDDAAARMAPVRTFEPCEVKEIVYENLRMDLDGRRSADRRLGGRCRTECSRKPAPDSANRRLLEYNFRFGKYEKKLSDFSAAESSFRDIYNAGVINGSAFEDYGAFHDGFSYLESKYTYSVTGIPGNLAQASAAAAFFAR